MEWNPAMSTAIINGLETRYEILGPAAGPAMTLMPGSRNPLEETLALAEGMAAAGYRVLVHDRRNCGASEVGFDPGQAEHGVWADDLRALLRQNDMLPAIIGGSSSGARTALTFALRYPAETRALLLTRVTGGGFAVRRLVEKYYDQHIRAASDGGMEAVCATEHFAEVIARRPANRDKLMAWDADAFIACMQSWKRHFMAGADLPLVGISADDLASLAMPVCIIPGWDMTHPGAMGERAARHMPDAEVHRIVAEDLAVDVSSPEEWRAKSGKMAAIFADFLARRFPGDPVEDKLSPS
jgi:pimeloyl-ACP methyl ester carboxylesterase